MPHFAAVIPRPFVCAGDPQASIIRLATIFAPALSQNRCNGPQVCFIRFEAFASSGTGSSLDRGGNGGWVSQAHAETQGLTSQKDCDNCAPGPCQASYPFSQGLVSLCFKSQVAERQKPSQPRARARAF